MKGLIIYDSFFGNTEQVAREIGKVLGAEHDVEVLRAGEVKPERVKDNKLLIVGSPTRKFRPVPSVTGLLGKIPKNGLKGVKAAAFDTRIVLEDANPGFLRFLMKRFGWAAQPIADRLVKKGGEMIVPPEGFAVKDSEGPLKEGEAERAADWAKRILAEI